MAETWRSIPGFLNYEASNKGNIRSWAKGSIRVLKPRINKPNTDNQYRFVGITDNTGSRRDMKVARCVLLAFIGLPPKGHEVCHNNGNSLDDRLRNLRWDTHRNNSADRIKHGTQAHVKGSKHGNSKLSEKQVAEIRSRSHIKQRQLANEYGVSPATICVILNRSGKYSDRWEHVYDQETKIPLAQSPQWKEIQA